ncbi:MAG TPA: tail fiber protein [Allosphingosinicella sp.]|jgi:microcystin-dependent protein
MSDPFTGEIRMFGGNYAPAGWMFCSGQLLPISEYEALYNLIGTTYGGDGQTNFALPNLQGRIPVHMGQGPGLSNRIIGEAAGSETVTLTTQQIPSHSHAMLATATGQQSSPDGALLATPVSTQAGVNAYLANTVPNVPLTPMMIQPAGGSQPHDNCQSYLCVSYIISLYGIYPPPS